MRREDGTFELGPRDGVRVAIHPFGARIAALWLPGPHGRINGVLGHATPAPPPADPNYLGSTVGRVSGRIAGSRFELDGAVHQLIANQGPNHLHGGPTGLHSRQWDVLSHDEGARPGVTLGLSSPREDGGYPGRVDVTASFHVDGDALEVNLTATCDAPTPVALTMHPYFNLSGDPARSIHDHMLTLAAGRYLELDPQFIPTGRLLPVEGSPFDFRTPARIGAHAPDTPALQSTAGYDHTWICDADAAWNAKLWHPDSGIEMKVSSNQPGIQFYAGQYLRPTPGVRWSTHCGLCLEPQQLPNAVNEPTFPSPILRPDQICRNSIRYSFMQR